MWCMAGAEYRFGCMCNGIVSHEECVSKYPGPAGTGPRHNFGMHCRDVAEYVELSAGMCNGGGKDELQAQV